MTTYLQTVADVLNWYQSNELRSYSIAAMRERRRIWDAFANEYGPQPVDACRGAMLLAFIVAQRNCKSDWPRRRIKVTILRPFNAAMACGLIPRNPFYGVKIPEGQRGRDWSIAEYQAALRCCTPRFRRF